MYDVTIACRRALHGLLEQYVAVRVEDGATYDKQFCWTQIELKHDNLKNDRQMNEAQNTLQKQQHSEVIPVLFFLKA